MKKSESEDSDLAQHMADGANSVFKNGRSHTERESSEKTEDSDLAQLMADGANGHRK